MNAARHLAAVPDPSDSRPPALLDDLLVQTGRGSLAAFDRLYGHIAGSVYGLALRVVRDQHLAEDIAQEVLVEVWRKAPGFRPASGSARAWIMTIAHRRAVDRVRSEQSHTNRNAKHGARDPQFAHMLDSADLVVEVAYAEWEASRVKSGLAALTPIQREAIELAYYQGLTHREVADSLGVPLGTAKARLRDGLIRLRDAWEGTS